MTDAPRFAAAAPGQRNGLMRRMSHFGAPSVSPIDVTRLMR